MDYKEICQHIGHLFLQSRKEIDQAQNLFLQAQVKINELENEIRNLNVSNRESS